jgi:hypothetical protein
LASHFFALLVFSFLAVPSITVNAGPSSSITTERGRIRVPDGFTIERVAGPPLVGHPMLANFDERGRLFIAESAGRNLRPAELETELPNFVRMLEDTDGDGVFRFTSRHRLTSGAFRIPTMMASLTNERLLSASLATAATRRVSTDRSSVQPVEFSGATVDTATSSVTTSARSPVRSEALEFSRCGPTDQTSECSAAVEWTIRLKSIFFQPEK